MRCLAGWTWVGLAKRGQRRVEGPSFGLDQFGLDSFVDPDSPTLQWTCCKTPPVPAENSKGGEKSRVSTCGRRSVPVTLTLMCLIVFALACRFRSRADVKLEVVAPHHQLTVPRRQRPRHRRLSPIDSSAVWVLALPLWPRCMDMIKLVKPAPVLETAPSRRPARFADGVRDQGGPPVERGVRDLIRRMSTASPALGRNSNPRRVLKLGIEVSQTTFAN
jgi:hypothetical protein